MMRPETWMFFAAAALQRTANPENHAASCKDAAKFADEMCKEFECRFEKNEEKYEFPPAPAFQPAETDRETVESLPVIPSEAVTKSDPPSYVAIGTSETWDGRRETAENYPPALSLSKETKEVIKASKDKETKHK